MRTYIAFYNGKQTTVIAASSFDAYGQAVAYFKPPMSKRHMVHVHLADFVHTATE